MLATSPESGNGYGEKPQVLVRHYHPGLRHQSVNICTMFIKAALGSSAAVALHPFKELLVTQCDFDGILGFLYHRGILRSVLFDPLSQQQSDKMTIKNVVCTVYVYSAARCMNCGVLSVSIVLVIERQSTASRRVCCSLYLKEI